MRRLMYIVQCCCCRRNTATKIKTTRALYSPKVSSYNCNIKNDDNNNLQITNVLLILQVDKSSLPSLRISGNFTNNNNNNDELLTGQ